MKNENARKKDIRTSLAVTGIFSVGAIVTAYTIQRQAEVNLGDLKCSYLDPISIDFLAFAAGIFLVCDGFYEILWHKDLLPQGKILASLRTAFGFAILTLHAMQFLHK